MIWNLSKDPDPPWPPELDDAMTRLYELELMTSDPKTWQRMVCDELFLVRSLSKALQVLVKYYNIYPVEFDLLWTGSPAELKYTWEILASEAGTLKQFAARFFRSSDAKPFSCNSLKNHPSKALPGRILAELRDLGYEWHPT